MVISEPASNMPRTFSPRSIPFSLRATLVGIIVVVFVILTRRYVVEDGLIYARFIGNALSGLGLVFNPGERVNALTSPLFTYVLLVSSWLLHGRIILAEHLLFAITFFTACLMAEDIAPFSGLLIAATGYFYTLVGLETSTFLLLLMVTAKAYQSKRYEWLPSLVVLALLTRFEAGLLIPVTAWALWRERKFPKLLSLVPAAALIVLYLVLNHHWYGAWLPNSATSKLGQARSGYWGPWPWAFLLARGWTVGPNGIFRRTMWLLPPLLILAVFGWDKMRRIRAGRVLTPFTIALFGFYVLFNIPAYHWYYAPFVFVLILYGVLGLPDTKPAYAILALCITLCAVLNGLTSRYAAPIMDYVNMAEWIDAHTPPNATVEAAEIGTIGWYTHRRVIDILGLTEPKNADHVAHHDLKSWLAEDQPDYIVVHRPMWFWEEAAKGSPEYQYVPFHSGNVYLLQKVGPANR